MFEKNNNIAYSFAGLQNLHINCTYALNNTSIISYLNDWVAAVIQYLVIGKAAGISLINVLNRPITKNLFSYSWCSAVKTFISAIAVSECFKSFKSTLAIKGANHD